MDKRRGFAIRPEELAALGMDPSAGYATFTTQFEKDHCQNCGKLILVMAFRGTGLCSVDCQKAIEKRDHG